MKHILTGMGSPPGHTGAGTTTLNAAECPQKCVELLRKQKLGVATFLILEKQQHLAAQMSRAASPPEGERPTAACHHMRCTECIPRMMRCGHTEQVE